jgi:cyclic beta-1,2-glucan synthetase
VEYKLKNVIFHFNFQPDFYSTGTDPLLVGINVEESLLQFAYTRFHKQYSAPAEVPPGVEWFLDNFYLVEQAIDQIVQDLQPDLLRGLSRNRGFNFSRYPKIYLLASAYMRASRYILNVEQIVRMLRTYQLNNELLMAEIWPLPTMFQRATIRKLAQTVEHLWLVSDSKNRSRVKSTDEQVFINCLRTLQTISSQNWEWFFEEVSLVEEILRYDPAGIYSNMDFDTRDSYRKVIEELASITGQDESTVASECVSLAVKGEIRQPQSNTLKRAPLEHVGYYLKGDGRSCLEATLGYQPGPKARLRDWLRKHTQLLYLGNISFFTLFFSALLGRGMWRAGCGPLLTGTAVLLALIPLINATIMLTDQVGAQFVTPKTLPKLDFDEGIPLEFKTMVIVPSIVGQADEVNFLLAQIECHYLGNPDRHLGFALLTDFLDAPQQNMPGDAALLERLAQGIRTLNDYYGQPDHEPFFWFHRHRAWNSAEEYWMGWERKRGKLNEFNRLLNGEETSFYIQVGDFSFLSGVRYVITLDRDTRLPRESACRLVATLSHPLNQAQFDPQQNRFVAGYTILQPRVEIDPSSLTLSSFIRIFVGETGLDLYTRAASDVYQDLFDEGIYVGKGIYDVISFRRSLDQRIPENAVISHDLLEGLYGRVGLVSDVVFYEDFPPHYLGFVRRLQRWVRGDWQLLPWLRRQIPRAGGRKEPSPFSMLDRWKIMNTLLQSLRRPALFGLLIAGWIWLPVHAAPWTVFVSILSAAEFFIGPFFPPLAGLRSESQPGLLSILKNKLARWLMAFIFLPFESWICLCAIALSLWRVFVIRKQLLMWTPSAQISLLLGNEIKPRMYWRQMLPGPLLSLGILGLVAFFNPAVLPAASPLLAVWCISPQVAWWISRPTPTPELTFTPDEHSFLLKLARRTWLYFEQAMGPQSNWLPADNYYETPIPARVAKTSPTNIGLALLATLAAVDCGYFGPRQLIARLERAIESLEGLPRYKGHFFNWYNIRDLSPHPPSYVSIVDSGNMAACLLALKQGLKDLPERTVLSQERWQGLGDALAVLREQITSCSATGNAPVLKGIAHLQDLTRLGRDNPEKYGLLLSQIVEEDWPQVSKQLMALSQNPRREMNAGSFQEIYLWVESVEKQLFELWEDTRLLAPWIIALRRPPTLFTRLENHRELACAWEAFRDSVRPLPRLEALPEFCARGTKQLEHLAATIASQEGPSREVNAARQWCLELINALHAARDSAQNLQLSLIEAMGWVEKTFAEMDFAFFFDRQRKVFSIGYDLEVDRPDISNYDLLASEARLASLVAIAKNDAPLDHWVHMARPMARSNGKLALLSWGGSLFEYLMPTLLMRTVPGTLLDRACRTAIAYHIAAGERSGLPWGFSESSCHPLDASQGYPYRTFGTKDLCINPKPVEARVIAPYATALSLPFEPRAAIANLRRLSRLGALGTYGLYEAVDFTPAYVSATNQGAVVPIYMTHHQGMVMLSLVNCLKQQIMIHRFHADPRIQTVELLLWEAPIDARNGKRREQKGSDLSPRSKAAIHQPRRPDSRNREAPAKLKS